MVREQKISKLQVKRNKHVASLESATQSLYSAKNFSINWMQCANPTYSGKEETHKGVILPSKWQSFPLANFMLELRQWCTRLGSFPSTALRHNHLRNINRLADIILN